MEALRLDVRLSTGQDLWPDANIDTVERVTRIELA
jgi:hypothetical protein